MSFVKFLRDFKCKECTMAANENKNYWNQACYVALIW